MTRVLPSDQFARYVARARASHVGSARSGIDVAEEAGLRVALTGHPVLAADAVGSTSRALALARDYATRGIDALRDLHGSFALVIAALDDSELLLAVDRVGIATLCYGDRDGAAFYASDAADVAADLRDGHALVPGGPGGLDPQAIFDYLYFHCIPGPSTVYGGVRRVEAGHVVRIRDGRATDAPYWAPSYDEGGRADVPALEREFLETVRESVARAIDGADRPGAFLSGGTDSSTVSGMLGEVTGAPAQTYSIGFDADGFDEVRFARIAAKRFGTEHHEYYITPRDLVDAIPQVAATYEQPFGNSSVLPTYYCAKMAAADGIDRLLGGDGGDELFGGNTRYAKQHVFDHFTRAPAPVKAVLRVALAPTFWTSVPLAGKARSYVEQADVRMPDRMQTYNLLTRIGIDRIFAPDFLATVDVQRPIADMRATWDQCETPSLLNRMLAFDLKYTLTDNDLPKVVNACRLAGVDVAFPLLDDALIAFAGRLDPTLKLRGQQLRWFFKHALRNFLPDEILNKSKHGFGLPFGLWLQKDAGLNALAFASLESLKQRGIVRTAFIDELRGNLLADHATYYGELVWVLMMLEQWLQTHQPSATFERT